MLTAAPIVKLKRSAMPAAAYTDFVKIFVDRDFNTAEHDTAVRHEQAHIWCEHNRRARKEFKIDVWKIACELEIARNIYTPDDISVITRPRSRLSGGYLPDTIDTLPPELFLAEEIYDWLITNPESMPQQQFVCECDVVINIACDNPMTKDEALSVISSACEKLDELKSNRQAQEQASTVIQSIKFRTPSLADSLDAILRHRIVREKSYRRPSRRNIDKSIIEKGRMTSLKRPLVEVFVDRSGSFDSSKTAAAEHTLKKILEKYNVQVKADVFYFGNSRISHDDLGGGGNTPYHLVSSHIDANRPKVAIVITDDDDACQCSPVSKETHVLCIPIGTQKTDFAARVGGKDVTL